MTFGMRLTKGEYTETVIVGKQFNLIPWYFNLLAICCGLYFTALYYAISVTLLFVFARHCSSVSKEWWRVHD